MIRHRDALSHAIKGDGGIRWNLKFREALTFYKVIKKCVHNQRSDRRGRSWRQPL